MYWRYAINDCSSNDWDKTVNVLLYYVLLIHKLAIWDYVIGIKYQRNKLGIRYLKGSSKRKLCNFKSLTVSLIPRLKLHSLVWHLIWICYLEHLKIFGFLKATNHLPWAKSHSHHHRWCSYNGILLTTPPFGMGSPTC